MEIRTIREMPVSDRSSTFRVGGDPEAPLRQRLRYKRQADIRKGVERVRQLDRLLQENWHRMAHGSSLRAMPAIGGRKTRLLPPLAGRTTENDGLQDFGTEARNLDTPRRILDSRNSNQKSKRVKNMYSHKASFFYEGQVSRLRMPAWKPLPSLKDRSTRTERYPERETADGSAPNELVDGPELDDGLGEGYCFKESFPPASNRTLQNTPRQLGIPLRAREPTVDFLSRVDRLLTSEQGLAADDVNSEALSSAHTSDIEANMDDVSGDVSCDADQWKAFPKEEDVSHEFMKLEGIVSGVYQRRPVDVKRKCLVWVNRHRNIKGYSIQ